MGKYVINVDGVVVRDDEYLFIERGADEEHAPGTLGFPGGTVEAPADEDEVLTTELRRELREEVDLTVGELEFVHSNTFELDTGSLCLNVLMLCEYTGGEARPKAEEEVEDVHWLSYEDLQAYEPVPPHTERFVEIVEAYRE